MANSDQLTLSFDPSQLQEFDPSQLTEGSAPQQPQVQSFDPSQLQEFDPSQLSEPSNAPTRAQREANAPGVAKFVPNELRNGGGQPKSTGPNPVAALGIPDVGEVDIPEAKRIFTGEAYEDIVPHPGADASTAQKFLWGAGKGLAQAVSPESALEMAALGVAGKAIPALANAPKIAEYLKDLPTVAKALDVMSHAALPAALTAQGAKGLYEQGMPKNAEQAGEAAVNALMLGLGAHGAIEAAKDVMGQYPSGKTAGTAEVGAAKPADQATASTAIDAQQAQANAESLAGHGSRLAAEQWAAQAEKTAARLWPEVYGNGAPVDYQGKPATVRLSAEKTKSGRPIFELVDDATGNVIHKDQAKSFAAFMRDSGAPAGEPAEAATEAAAPAPGTAQEFNPEDLTEAPAAQTPQAPETPQSQPQGFDKDAEFEGKNGKFTVLENNNGRIKFQKQSGDRTFTGRADNEDQFRAILAKAGVQLPEVSTPGQPVSEAAAPAAPSTPVVTPSTPSVPPAPIATGTPAPAAQTPTLAGTVQPSVADQQKQAEQALTTGTKPGSAAIPGANAGPVKMPAPSAPTVPNVSPTVSAPPANEIPPAEQPIPNGNPTEAVQGGADLPRAMEIQKEFGLSPAEAAVINHAIDRASASLGRYSSPSEAIQKEALRIAAPTGVPLTKVGSLALAKAVAGRYMVAAPAPSTTGLGELGGGAQAISKNMRDMLWDKAQKGDVNEAGAPSPILQIAKFARDAGGLQTREQFDQMTNEYGKAMGLPKEQRRPAFIGLARKYAGMPAAEPKQEAPVATPATAESATVPNAVAKPEGYLSPDSVGLVTVQDGPIKGLFPKSPLAAEDFRRQADPVLDLNRRPTGWLEIKGDNGTTLIHPDDDRFVTFTANDRSSGSDVLRAKAEAQAYAIDHPVKAATPEEPKPAATPTQAEKEPAPEATTNAEPVAESPRIVKDEQTGQESIPETQEEPKPEKKPVTPQVSWQDVAKEQADHERMIETAAQMLEKAFDKAETEIPNAVKNTPHTAHLAIERLQKAIENTRELREKADSAPLAARDAFDFAVKAAKDLIARAEKELAEKKEQKPEPKAETPAPAEPKPQYTRGQSISFTGRTGETLTGTVRSDFYPGQDDKVSVKVDQSAKSGGVPVGRVEYVSPEKVQATGGPEKAAETPAPAAKPVPKFVAFKDGDPLPQPGDEVIFTTMGGKLDAGRVESVDSRGRIGGSLLSVKSIDVHKGQIVGVKVAHLKKIKRASAPEAEKPTIGANGQSPAKREPKDWLGSLPEDRRELVYEEMRAVNDEAARQREKSQSLSSRTGELAVGGAHMDPLFRADALEGLLRSLRKGETVPEAVAAGNADANEAIEKWNRSRPKDYVVHRGKDSELSGLEGIGRRITKSAEAETQSGAAKPSLSAQEGASAPAVSPTAKESGVEAKADEAEEKHELSSTQVDLRGTERDAVRAFGRKIPDADLAEDGREENPHTTVLYGLTAEDPAEAQKIIEAHGPVTAKFGKTSLFRNDDADVLKVDIESPDLANLNSALARLPNESTHPEYIPHVTIAYLKPGTGDKYAGKDVPGLTGKSITFHQVTFSSKNGEKTDVGLKGEEAPGQSTDLAGAAGMSADDIIAAATKALEARRGPAKKAEAPNAEQPKSEQPKSEAPKEEPRTETKQEQAEQPKSERKNPLRDAANASRERLRNKARGGQANSGIDPQDLVDLATIGAEHIIDGAHKFADWSRKVTEDVGDLVDSFAEATKQPRAAILRQIHEYARKVAKNFDVEAEETPKGELTTEEGRVDAERSNAEAAEPAAAEPGEVQTGGGAERSGDENPEPLDRVPSEDVQGTEGEGSSVPVSAGGGADDGLPAGGTEAGGHPVRSGKRGGAKGVVSAPEREGSAEPDVRPGRSASDVGTGPGGSGNAPTATLSADFSLTPEQAAAIENGGARTKARNNLEAIRTIKKIEAEGNRAATLEEQQSIAKYVGWGDGELANGIFGGKPEWAGIREELKSLLTPEEFDAARESTINAHYTRRDVATAMWDAARHMGFRAGGMVLEPGMGIGNFFMMMPEDLQSMTSRTGIEMDLMTGNMAKALYPGSNIVIKPMQETNLPEGYFDLAIGNVPFANTQVNDPVFRRFPYLTQNLHNYFFAKTIEKVRPGGVMLAITSRYTLDGVDGKKFRSWMAERAELLGAVRLPRDTFKANAGTSVTVDVIALRKRIPNDPMPVSKETWTDSKTLQTKDGYAVPVNEYFHRHPEMMMGEMKGGTQYYRGYPELFGDFSLDKLNDLFSKLPKDAVASWSIPAATNAAGELVENFPGSETIKEGQYTVHNGALVRREGAYMRPVPLTGARLERAKGLDAIRNAVREVLRTQYLDMPEAEILAARKGLNDAYDAFTGHKALQGSGKGKKANYINSLANAMVFGDDPDWPLLSSLEDFDKETKSAKKRAIFTERTIQKPKPIDHVDTGSEALAVSLNDLGRIDWDRMQQLTGREPSELQKELAGKLFRNPITRQWETADEYLSGNVRKKLADAEFAAKSDPEAQSNVDALRAVQPRDLAPGEIDAPPGANWIPDRVYEQFVREVLKGQSDGKIVTYVPQTGGHAISKIGRFSDDGVANNTEFGTAYFDGMDLFEDMMNGRSPIAYDTDWDAATKSEKRVKNAKETIKALEKTRVLGDRFSQWLWSDAERTAALTQKYNVERNNLRLREYDGSHLAFPGMNKSWLRDNDLDPHQKNAVWRVLQTGNTLLAHAVGAGKTLEMIASAMESRRLGLARKPMGVVPNHLVGQWKDDFLRAYPGAQLLVPTKRDFDKKNRLKLMSKIATGNYDAVLVGHKSFELLSVKDETYRAFIGAELKEINDAIDIASAGLSKRDKGENPTIKNLVRRKKSLEAKLQKRLNKEKKDQTVSFEELGVDMLFVDESHYFKNLGYTTQMDRIAGLPNTDSNRSTDMLMKTRYVSYLHGGQRGVVFASGTPVSNSIAETWTNMRYLMPKYLDQEGMDQFDAWAKTFGKAVTRLEVAPEGGRFISRRRFAEFNNAPELMSMFRLVADIRTAEQLNLPIPAVDGGGPQDVVAPASEMLKAFVKSVGERADRIRAGGVKPEEDNMLKISSDARKASLDLRLMSPTAPDDPNSKANLAVKKIAGIYREFANHKGTQLVFLDLSTPKAQREKGDPADAESESRVANEPTADKEAGILASRKANLAEEEPADGAANEIYGSEKPEEEEQDTETADEANERFTVYNEIRNKLIKDGVKPEEIAFIHDAKTDGQKKDLFDKMNAGHVRVLLGSTEKMGAGMNVQNRLVALHHLDAPWRPSDVEQREGRIKRQGNMLWNQHKIPVRIFRYLTEGSFDSFMWETIIAKARPITQLMNGDPSIRRIEEMGPAILSYEQAKAASAGNPLVREKILLDQDINKIEIMRGQWMTEQASVQQQLARLPGQLSAAKTRIQNLEDDITTRDNDRNLVVNGKKYAGEDIRKDGANALVELLKKTGPVFEATPIKATYRGFGLAASPDFNEIAMRETKTGEFVIRERTDDKQFVYSTIENAKELTQIRSQRGGLLRSDIKAEPVDRKVALRLDENWDKLKEFKDFGLIKVGALPRLRLVANSAGYAVSPNYESPAYTISSADYQIKDFEADLKEAKGAQQRLETKGVELQTKVGRPFTDEEKLQKMRRRQAELEQELGENKDDNQAVAMAEEGDGAPVEATSAMDLIRRDPDAAMSPDWFPKKKYFRSIRGRQVRSEGRLITKHVMVNDLGHGHFAVDNAETGELLTSRNMNGTAAVAFARKLESAVDWSNPQGIEAQVQKFEKTFKAPEGTPEQTLEKYEAEFQKLKKERNKSGPEKTDPSAAEVESNAAPAPVEAMPRGTKESGPMRDYKKGKQDIKAPDGGWYQSEVDGKTFYSDGHMLLEGKAPGALKEVKQPDMAPFLETKNEEPVKPLAYSKPNSGLKVKRLVWFGDGKSAATALDAKYYDKMISAFPDATFTRGDVGRQSGIIVAHSGGRVVGVVMPIDAVTPPAVINPYLKPGEAGSAPMLMDLAQAIVNRFGKTDAALANYSGLGALERRFMPGGNLAQTERADPKVAEAMRQYASHRSHAAAVVRWTTPKIEKALEGSGVNYEELRRYYSDSRLQGIRQRWFDLSDQVDSLDDDQWAHAYNDHFTGFLSSIENKRGLPQDLAHTAAALLDQKNYADLKDLLSTTFMDAGSMVAELMDPDRFDEIHDMVRNDPRVREADRIYGEHVEKPMSDAHAIHEGVFSDARGPANRYIPLVGMTEEEQPKGFFGAGKPYRKPENERNRMATGISEHGYDTSIQAFVDAMGNAIRRSDKFNAMKIAEKAGLWSEFNGAVPKTYEYRGIDYIPETFDITEPKILIQNGKAIRVAGKKGVAPDWFVREIKPIMESDKPADQNRIQRLIETDNAAALVGPALFMIDSANIFGTLAANTPFLGTSLLDKAASAPLLKRITAIVYALRTIPSGPEAAQDILDMAKAGSLPAKYAKKTWSRETAEQTGANLAKWWDMSPALYGPDGLDIRARLLLWRIAKAANPSATPTQMHHFVNQIGTYIPGLQSDIERAMKKTGLSPFITRGQQMIVNGLNAVFGTGPMPKSGRDSLNFRIWQQITGGALGLLVLWALLHKHQTGKYPWDDSGSRFGYVPLTPAQRDSPIGKALCGTKPGTCYVPLSFFNPIVMRGLRATGIPAAADAAAEHGAPWQVAEAGATQALNTFGQPLAGPVVHQAFILGFGKEPYLTSMRDRSGYSGPQLFPAVPPKEHGTKMVIDRAKAAFLGSNAMLNSVGESTGFLGPDAGKAQQQPAWWARQIMDLAIGSHPTVSNQHAKAEMLRGQRTGTR